MVNLIKTINMNYKFLTKESLIKFFEESELSVGEIMRSITQEKFTGIRVDNRTRFTEIPEKQWYEIIEKAFEYEQE